jgi:acetyl esterase
MKTIVNLLSKTKINYKFMAILGCVMMLHFQFQNNIMAQDAAAGAGRRAGGRGDRSANQPAAPIDGKFSVTVDQLTNGSIKVTPALPENGRVDANTVLTLTATPAEGFALDSLYYLNTGARGMSGGMYYESMDPEFKVKVDQNKRIGASFIEKKALEGFTVKNNIVFAQPGVKKLKYDVFSPNGAKNLPCVVIIHGGGWSTNCEDVMRGLAWELCRDGKYVVCSIDYRWAQRGDGDEKPNTMADIIEDVYGAIAHIQEHASEYGADPTRLAVTGDSAGGQLSAAAINMVSQIGDGGFGIKPGVFQFKPTYMPKNKTVEQVRKEITAAIKAAAPSYGVFENLNAYSNDPAADRTTLSNAVSPINFIPDVKERAVPQFLTRGTNDNLIRNENVQKYVDALKAKGQTVVYLQPEGAAHAFFDWKPDARTKATFVQYGIPYAAKMKEFFNTIFYP